MNGKLCPFLYEKCLLERCGIYDEKLQQCSYTGKNRILENMCEAINKHEQNDAKRFDSAVAANSVNTLRELLNFPELNRNNK